MDISKLKQYVREQKEAGFSEQEIRAKLISSGWDLGLVDKVFREGDEKVMPEPPSPALMGFPSTTAPQKDVSQAGMWEAFEHILQFISLYVLATAVALLLGVFIDKWMPGVDTRGTNYYYTPSNSYQTTLIRGYLSAIIVSFPLFAFFFVRITRRTELNPELKKLKARKFFIYVTLVGTFLVMLGKAIQTIYTLLAGNVTVNFLLHLTVILGISGMIFFYYLGQVKEDRGS